MSQTNLKPTKTFSSSQSANTPSWISEILPDKITEYLNSVPLWLQHNPRNATTCSYLSLYYYKENTTINNNPLGPSNNSEQWTGVTNNLPGPTENMEVQNQAPPVVSTSTTNFTTTAVTAIPSTPSYENFLSNITSYKNTLLTTLLNAPPQGQAATYISLHRR